MSEHREHLLPAVEDIPCRGALMLGRRANVQQRIYPRSRAWAWPWRCRAQRREREDLECGALAACSPMDSA